jgi:multidrug efflux pump subunit AcrA (membrane-fusion protein)
MTRIWLVLLAALGALVAGGCGKKEEAELPPAPAPVQVTPVRLDSIRRVVNADGVLYPRDQSNIFPKITAPVQRFYVNRGAHVRRGQLLATLENRDLTAAAAESRGQLAQSEANYRQTASATVPEEIIKAEADVTAAKEAVDAAQKLVESRQSLLQQGALARRPVDEAQVALAQARASYQTAQEHLRALQSVGREETVKGAAAQVETAKAHLQGAEAQVGYSEIHSPMNGIVSDRPLYEGDLAQPGTPMFTIMDISSIVARVNVPQAAANEVKIGDSATISQGDNGFQVLGKVTVVSPATDPNTTTVQVWIQADNPGERLKPGAAVHAAIVTGTIVNAIVVPPAAILPFEEGGSAVAVVGGDNVVHLMKVAVGVREPEKVQILGGASPGEQVVVTGGVGLDDKAKVRIVQPKKDEDEDEEDAPAGDEKGAKEEKK